MTALTRQWLRNVARHDVIPGSRLRAAGVSIGTVKHLVRSERLYRVHRDVFVLSPTLDPEGQALAAVLACGEGAALSYVSAAALWRLVDRWPVRLHVTVPRSGGRRDPAALRVHRSTTLTRADTTYRHLIPVTTLPRTLDDLARTSGRPALKAAVRNAERLHRIDLARLRARATHARLKALLDTYLAGSGLTANELEALFYELCARVGLPLPSVQHATTGRRVDFAWPDIGLIVETDGRETHDTVIAFQDDRARDRRLKRAGWEVIRFTWAEVAADPGLVERDLLAAYKTAAGRRTRRSSVPQAR